MRVVIVYKDNSEYTRSVYDFLRDYEARTGKQLETINPDTREGSYFCRLYDIVEYPSIVAVTDSGSLQYMWRGLPLPLINEVSYYDKIY